MGNLSSPTPDATTTTKGKVQLTGSLSGTAASPALRFARQNDTNNTTVTGGRIESGWGVMTLVSGTITYNETVTFGTAFGTIPIINVSAAGDNITATGAALGNGGNNIAGTWFIKHYSDTISNFVVKMDTTTGSVGANGFVYYTWTAVGS